MFRQDQTIFGSEAEFVVEFSPGRKHKVAGGRRETIRLDQVGTFRIRASIDDCTSVWVTVNVAENDIVQLMIAPPQKKGARAFGLLMGKKEYLTIHEIGRSKA
jgi:hypothetical protein